VRFIVSPGTPESAILEKAFSLLGGPRHWLPPPPAGVSGQSAILAALFSTGAPR